MMLDAFKEKRDDVVAAVRDLAALADAVGASHVAEHLRTGPAAKLLADRFHLVVVGEFNRGKTTLINALLGSSALPVGVTPTTSVIHEIDYAETPSASILYESGETQELPFDDVRLFALGCAPPRPDAGPVKLLRVGYPAPVLRDHVTLIDTPGVNDLSLQRADITYNYIPQSDAVLFLLDASQLLTESERLFLQEKLIGQSRNKIVFLITKKDIFSPAELGEAIAYVEHHVREILPAAQVFALSALGALEGERGESGIDELVGFLGQFLSQQRGAIMLENALHEAIRVCAVLSKALDAKRRGLDMSVDEIDRRIAAVNELLHGQSSTMAERRARISQEIAAVKAWSLRDLHRMVDDVTRQLPGIIDGADVDDIKRYLGSFLDSVFHDWADAETREIAEALEKMAETAITLVRDDARGSTQRLADTVGGGLTPPTVAIDTFAYDVGVAMLPIVGVSIMITTNLLLGGLMILASPVLAVVMRGRIDRQTRERAKEIAPAAVREAATKVAPTLAQMIDEFGERLDAWVVNAGEAVYRGVIEVLAAAKEQRQKGEPAVRTAIDACAEQCQSLDALKARYQKMLSSL